MKKILIVGLLILVVLVVIGTYTLRSSDIAKTAVEASAPRAFLPKKLEAYVEKYDAMGPHRTGAPSELERVNWLDQTLSSFGYQTRRQSFDIWTDLDIKTDLKINGSAIAAFPQFPVKTTVGEFSGPVSLWNPDGNEDYAGKIVLIDIPLNRNTSTLAQESLYRPIRMASDSGALAVLVMIRSECGTYKMLNADVNLPLWRIPVVQVGDENIDALQSAANEGQTASLSVTASRRMATGINVIAEIGPKNVSPIVVSTPHSGWFNNAGERGSGIAAFLALAEWAQSQTDRHFIFVANSGHERGNLGAVKYLDEQAPTPDKSALWIHIGANVGSAEIDGSVSTSRYLMTNWNHLLRSGSLFWGQPGYDVPIPLELGLAHGELMNVYDAEYKDTLGIFGSSPRHHCANDRKDAVLPDAINKAAISLAAFIEMSASD